MIKSQLINQVYQQTEYSKDVISGVLEAVMESIKEQNGQGNDVIIRGFGAFKVVQTKEKKARNIREDMEFIIPARKIVKFKASKEYKNMVLKGRDKKQ